MKNSIRHYEDGFSRHRFRIGVDRQGIRSSTAETVIALHIGWKQWSAAGLWNGSVGGRKTQGIVINLWLIGLTG